MPESRSKNNGGEKVGIGSSQVSLAALVVGVLLILASLVPFGNAAQEALWTETDSSAYDQISQEYHRLSYQSPEKAGVTEHQLQAQVEKSRQQFETLKTKLQHANGQPVAWNRYLLWSGAMLVAVGVLASTVPLSTRKRSTIRLR